MIRIDTSDPMWLSKPFDAWRARLDLQRRAGNEKEFKLSARSLGQYWGWSEQRSRRFLAGLCKSGFLKKNKGEGFSATSWTVCSPDDEIAIEEQAKAKAAKPRPLPTPGPAVDRVPAPVATQTEIQLPRRATRKSVAQDTPPPIPAELDTDEFREAWELRLRERGIAGKSPNAAQLLVHFKKLVKLAKAKDLQAAIEAVERATVGGWSGVVYAQDFENDDTGGKPQKTRLPTRIMLFDESAAQAEEPHKMPEEEPSQWVDFKNVLRDLMTRDDYAAFASPMDFDHTSNDGKLVARVPNSHFMNIWETYPLKADFERAQEISGTRVSIFSANQAVG